MKAVFLDRDGVITVDRGFVHKIEDFALLPGSANAIKSLKKAGYLIIIVTNQSGIGRGYYSEEQFSIFNKHMIDNLDQLGAKVDAVYYCPHHPDAAIEKYRKVCDCRKPEPGMILKAAKELDINTCNSWFIGDRLSDIEAGKKAGCRTILITNSVDEKAKPDFSAKNLADAARYILIKKNK